MIRNCLATIVYSATYFALVFGLAGTDRRVHAQTFDQIGGTFVPFTFSGDQAAASQFDALGPGFGTRDDFATAYDNFSFAGTLSVVEVDWVGEFFDDDYLLFDLPDFQLQFHADSPTGPNGSEPGALLKSYDFTQFQVNATPLADNFVSYSVDLASDPFGVTGGTEYWISVVADVDVDQNEWGLAYSDSGPDGDDFSVQDFDLDLVGPRDRFYDTPDFALSITAVPEPGSLAILLVSGSMMVLRRRKRTL
ncbi:MAG: PEP-CTERM sorting domain-containing protein [Planctomycetota bacterium]